MPSKPSPNSLIHCAVCGEDYSATYKRCPFCGAKNAPSAPQPPAHRREPEPEAPPPPPRRPAPEDPDDTYVFDGQDLFDEDPEEDYRPARPKGGKRLAEKPSSNPFADAQINWPRMITFLCSLVIIIAALVIVFTVIYPQLRGDKDPVANGTEQPSAGVTDPVSGVTEPPVGPGATDPVPGVTQPPVDPSITDPPAVGDDEPTGLTLSTTDVTLYPVENGRPVALRNYFQLKATVTPADWNGTVTFESSDPSLATVSADGTVSHANPDVTRLHQVVITVRAGTLEAECIVRIAPKPATTQPPATPAPAQTDPPVTDTQAPSSGGNVTVGRSGVVVNAEGGLRVRSGPGTTYAVLATVWNNTPINVVADAGGGWYEITYAGTGGTATTGYIMGEYISTN